MCEFTAMEKYDFEIKHVIDSVFRPMWQENK